LGEAVKTGTIAAFDTAVCHFCARTVQHMAANVVERRPSSGRGERAFAQFSGAAGRGSARTREGGALSLAHFSKCLPKTKTGDC